MAIDRTSFWYDRPELPTVTITRWDGKGFTSIVIEGDDRDELGIYLVSKLSEHDSPVTAVRVIRRAGFVTPTKTQPPAFIADAYGRKRPTEMAVVTACLEWQKEKRNGKPT